MLVIIIIIITMVFSCSAVKSVLVCMVSKAKQKLSVLSCRYRNRYPRVRSQVLFALTSNNIMQLASFLPTGNHFVRLWLAAGILGLFFSLFVLCCVFVVMLSLRVSTSLGIRALAASLETDHCVLALYCPLEDWFLKLKLKLKTNVKLNWNPIIRILFLF